LPLPWRTGQRDRLLPPTGRIPGSRGALPCLRSSLRAARTYLVYPRSRPCPTSLKRPISYPTTSRALSKLLVMLTQMWRRCPSPVSSPPQNPFLPPDAAALPQSTRCPSCGNSPRDEPRQDRNCVNKDLQEKLIRDQLDQQVRNAFKSPLIHGIVFGSRFGSGGLIDQELGF
jgi:hypothetical protein